ncbi:MAG: NAD(P)/FAD-dependent oxidoreductase [Pseudomonadota bacterium]
MKTEHAMGARQRRLEMMGARDWLKALSTALAAGDPARLAPLFQEQTFWRDYLPFGWTLQTVEGREAVVAFGAETGPSFEFKLNAMEGNPDEQEGIFTFQTARGAGTGHLRLEDGRCKTLFTRLDEPEVAAPPHTERDPYVLIVGGGQGGLALSAQLADLNVPHLVVDRYPRVGDQWRSRYDSLHLHDPVWYDHMPFKPFPDDWPVFTPKDMMGDWLEAYAEELNLPIWTQTEFLGAEYSEDDGRWTARIRKPDEEVVLRPTHLVFAMGISGFPRTPQFPGQSDLAGKQFHSSAYKDGAEFANKDIVIVGSNNSAHDIAVDLVSHGARPTMIQRSTTHVVRQDDFCERMLKALYSREAVASGITVEKADILGASMPQRLAEPLQKKLWDGIRRDRADFYQALTDAGFALDFAEDGTGLGTKYRRTASGYYIDVGGSQMVVDGRIKVRSGYGLERISANSVTLTNGDELQADAIVYATGYGPMTDWIAKLIDEEIAAKVGPCWGYGSGTKGDPGPWVGELRNMWMPTAQEGLWLMGGNLAQARSFSRLLALQLLGRMK